MGRRSGGSGAGRKDKNQAATVAADAWTPKADGTVAEDNEDEMAIPEATWPDAMPHPQQELIFTISCGNTHYYWAMHTGPSTELLANLYWRTCTLSESEMMAEEPCKVLARYLPDAVQEIVYGTKDHKVQKRVTALRHFTVQRIPFFSVYIVSTNPRNEAGLAYLFRDLPCRCFKFSGHHFFSPEQGAYPGMGVDRLASARGAVEHFGAPALVIDGGTAMTFTGVNQDGQLQGGGICAGLAMELRALHDQTGRLPAINLREELDAIQQNNNNAAATTTTPLPLFCDNTKPAMMSTVLRSKLRLVHEVITEFGERYPKHSDLTVCLAGGDGKILEEMLQDGQRILDFKQPLVLPSNVTVVYHKYLIHMGVTKVIMDEYVKREAETSEIQAKRDELIGLRVARNFPNRPDVDGDTVYRGTVFAVDSGEPVDGAQYSIKDLDNDLFLIMFDDGDKEDLSIQELYDSLHLFVRKGEKWQTRSPDEKSLVKAKLEASSNCCKKLAETSESIKQRIQLQEERQRKKELEALAKRSPQVPQAVVDTETPATASVSMDAAASKKRSLSPRAAEAEKAAGVDAAGADAAAGSSSGTEPAKKKAHTHAAEATAPVTEEGNESPELLTQAPVTEARPAAANPPVAAKRPGKPKESPAAKAKPKSKYTSEMIMKEPKSVLNLRVSKYFDVDGKQVLYFGTVQEFFPADTVTDQEDLWHVVYDDDDEEDYDITQIIDCLHLYEKKKNADKKAKKT